MSEAWNRGGKLRWWWPAVVLMAIIFVWSTDLGASSHQSRFLLPFLRWLGFGDGAMDGIILAIRKSAHLTEYAFLAVLLWRAQMRRPAFRPPVIWRWLDAYPVFVICVAYAALDEIHQAFVPSRTGSVGDVMFDAGGAALGLALLWWWHRSRAAKAAS